MSETRGASTASMDSKPARKTIRKVIIDESDDERENFNDICDECYSERLKNLKQIGENFDEAFSRRRVTSISVHSVAGVDIKKGIRIACLICQRKIVCPNSKSSSFLAYYICDECMENEKEQTRILETAIKDKEKLRSVSVGCVSTSPSRCDCKNCLRRETLEKERLREVELLRSYWNDLKKNIRLMFRNGLTADMCSLKGKKYDIDRLKRHVEILTEKDPPQLYRRLESIGYEQVMNLKSDDLWQILVAPQVVPALIKLYQSGADHEKIELERAKLFIDSLLKSFTRHQETVRNMSSLLAPLDDMFLKQFGICWKVVNHRIFDRVIYQDELLSNFLPKMEKVLKCDLIVPEETEEESANRAKVEAARTDISQEALELVRRFRFLHNLMITSREIFKKADAHLVLFAEQQDILNQLSRHAKQELFEESVDFFESQRKIMRNNPSCKRHFYRWHPDFSVCGEIEGPFYEEDDNSDYDTDTVNFTRRMYELIEEGPPESVCVDHNGKIAPCMKCEECSTRHCSCEECRIAHIITCGILDQDSETTKNLIWRKRLSESGIEEGKPKCGKSRKRRASSEESEYFDARDTAQARIAKTLISFHDSYDKRDIAWGEWQVPYHYYHDFEDVGKCLNEKNNRESLRLHGKRASCSESACFDNEEFMCSKEFAAAVKAVAKQMGCSLKNGFVVGPSSERSSSSEPSPTRSLLKHGKDNEKRDDELKCENQRSSDTDKENFKNAEKVALQRSCCSKDQPLFDGRKIESCEVSSTSSEQSTSSDGDWTHVRLDDRILDRKSWEGLRDKILAESGHFIVTEKKHTAVIEGDQELLKEVASGKFTLLSTGNVGTDDKALQQQEECKKLRIMDTVKDFFAKGPEGGTERANLRAVVWAAQHSRVPGPISVSHAKTSPSKKKPIKKEAAKNGTSSNESKPVNVAVESAEKTGVLAKSSVIAVERSEDAKPTSDKPKVVPFIEKVKVSVGSCTSSGRKVGGPFHGRSVASLLSASVDLHRDNMDEKEKNQLKKLIAQAAGARLDKMASVARSMDSHCAGLRHRCCDSKADFFCYHSECENEDYSEDAEEDSDEEWSDCEENKHPDPHHTCDNKRDFGRTPSSSRRDARHGHCDCCYCEMFGHTALETARAGRVPQIRERLRQKLQRRNGQEEKPDENKSVVTQESGAGNEKPQDATTDTVGDVKGKVPIVSDAPIEVILDYINEKDNAAAQAAANKAAKRARQKLRKQEEKERLELEKKKKDELRKAQQAEALRRKKEQQAANREQALKAEEKRKKAAEERAKEQKRQKELREQERHNKRQERLQKENSTKEVLPKKPNGENSKKGPKKQQNVEVNNTPKKKDNNLVKVEDKEKVKSSEARNTFDNSPLKTRESNAPKLKTVSQKSKASVPGVVKKNDSQISMSAMVTRTTKKQQQTFAPASFSKSVLVQPDSHWKFEQDQNTATSINLEKKTKVASVEVGQEVEESCQLVQKVTEIKAPFNEVNPLVNYCSLEPNGVATSIQNVSAATSEVHESSVLLSRTFEFSNQSNPVDVQQKVFESPSNVCGADAKEIRFNPNINCTETTSSNSSASSSLSSVSTQHSYYEFNPYFQAWAPNNYDKSYASSGVDLHPMLLGLPGPWYCLPYCTSNSEPPSFCGSPFIDHNNAFTSSAGFDSSPQDYLVNEVPLQDVKLDEDAPPGSSHFTAAVRAKRNETRKAFLSAVPDPLTNYDLETKQLVAELESNSLYSHLDPVIFAPGDPRISAAIASMKFDPHEAFKPRPDSELEFLDPWELEIEHFKRLMWESKGDRMPLRELPNIELENDANAVFHFAPLV